MQVYGVQSPYNPYMNQGQPPLLAPMSALGVNDPYGSDSANIMSGAGNFIKSSPLTKLVSGGYGAFKFTKDFANGKPAAGVMPTLTHSMGVGAAISGGISAIANIGALTHGRQSASTTVGNILTDTIQGGISGVAGVGGGYLSNMAFKAMGMAAGTPLIIATVIGGAVSAVAANKLLNTEAIRKSLTR